MNFEPSAPSLRTSAPNEQQAFNPYPYPQEPSDCHHYPPPPPASNIQPMSPPPAHDQYLNQNTSPVPGSPPYTASDHPSTSYNPPPPQPPGDIEAQPQKPTEEKSDGNDDDLPSPSAFFFFGFLLGVTIPLLSFFILPFLHRLGVKERKRRFMVSGLITAAVIQVLSILVFVVVYFVFTKGVLSSF